MLDDRRTSNRAGKKNHPMAGHIQRHAGIRMVGREMHRNVAGTTQRRASGTNVRACHIYRRNDRVTASKSRLLGAARKRNVSPAQPSVAGHENVCTCTFLGERWFAVGTPALRWWRERKRAPARVRAFDAALLPGVAGGATDCSLWRLAAPHAAERNGASLRGWWMCRAVWWSGPGVSRREWPARRGRELGLAIGEISVASIRRAIGLAKARSRTGRLAQPSGPTLSVSPACPVGQNARRRCAPVCRADIHDVCSYRCVPGIPRSRSVDSPAEHRIERSLDPTSAPPTRTRPDRSEGPQERAGQKTRRRACM